MSGTGAVDVVTSKATSAILMSLIYRPAAGRPQTFRVRVSDTYWLGEFGVRFTTVAIKNAFKAAYGCRHGITVSIDHGPLTAAPVIQPGGGQQPHTEAE